eukprot:CAMPEP_0203748824 /NCGR_PEP_ID=MMETSP0098-20131031/3601_1 /ASSEMBLY_ACC=CAM_ASM_000208 /TAXON_ID=96639 /ORGANISM=" , Strain NY0313808BC1" /LENGTH=669 /DNA_ID=CAMNT_0050637703 /DNA_START=385 /DNA_END=2394 /DNA_ORIENTATION=+
MTFRPRRLSNGPSSRGFNRNELVSVKRRISSNHGKLVIFLGLMLVMFLFTSEQPVPKIQAFATPVKVKEVSNKALNVAKQQTEQGVDNSLRGGDTEDSQQNNKPDTQELGRAGNFGSEVDNSGPKIYNENSQNTRTFHSDELGDKEQSKASVDKDVVRTDKFGDVENVFDSDSENRPHMPENKHEFVDRVVDNNAEDSIKSPPHDTHKSRLVDPVDPDDKPRDSINDKKGFVDPLLGDRPEDQGDKPDDVINNKKGGVDPLLDDHPEVKPNDNDKKGFVDPLLGDHPEVKPGDSIDNKKGFVDPLLGDHPEVTPGDNIDAKKGFVDPLLGDRPEVKPGDSTTDKRGFVDPLLGDHPEVKPGDSTTDKKGFVDPLLGDRPEVKPGDSTDDKKGFVDPLIGDHPEVKPGDSTTDKKGFVDPLLGDRPEVQPGDSTDDKKGFVDPLIGDHPEVKPDDSINDKKGFVDPLFGDRPKVKPGQNSKLDDSIYDKGFGTKHGESLGNSPLVEGSLRENKRYQMPDASSSKPEKHESVDPLLDDRLGDSEKHSVSVEGSKKSQPESVGDSETLEDSSKNSMFDNSLGSKMKTNNIKSALRGGSSKEGEHDQTTDVSKEEDNSMIVGETNKGIQEKREDDKVVDEKDALKLIDEVDDLIKDLKHFDEISEDETDDLRM